jgi:high-affinity iron transporter
VGSAFLIMLREGLEAALVVAIVLAYLKRLGRESDYRAVWIGAAAAGLVALVAGAALFAFVGELHGRAEQVTEGLIAAAAAGILTWMIFWMAKQARWIKGELHAKVDAALASGSTVALAAIAFLAILREGLESSLFLISTTVGERSNAAQLTGGLIGLVAAAGVGYLVFKGSRRVNLRVFFRITGGLIILFAAGLVASSVHEFQEAGFIGTAVEHLWNVGSVRALNPELSWFGETLKGLFGWSPAPSLEMLVAYLLFLIPIGGAFLAQTARVPRALKTRTAEASAPTA